MSLFIKTDTMEYPRYEGDIANEPNANWAEVERTTMPEYAVGQASYELTPILVNNTWTQQWAIRDLTPEELLQEKQSRLEQFERLCIPAEDIERLLSSGE
jgi:hypothetical protein